MSMKKWLAGLCALFLLLTGCSPAAEEVPSTNTPTEEVPSTNTPTEEESPMSISDKVEQLMAMRDLDEIFALENDTDFSIALGSALDDWTAYGENLDFLSPEAQTFYLCNIIELQVNSEGFLGFIFECYGQWASETVTALETIGAPMTADICRRAIGLLPDGVCPKDYIERENILFTDYDGYSDAYNKLDDEFYAYPDGVLETLYVSYARDHRDCFSAPEQ